MNRLIFIAVAGALIGFGAPALAADWSGGYVGVNLGGAWGNSNVATKVGANAWFVPTSISAIDSAAHAKLSPSGFTGGGQIGFNHQIGRWVVGLEADTGALSLSKSTSTGVVTYPCCTTTTFTVQQTVKTTWVETIRPRVGWASKRWLVYATGGVARTDLKYTEKFRQTYDYASETGSESVTKFGWTAGAGGEWKVGPHISLKAEYLHDDFGKISSRGDLSAGTRNPGATLLHSADLTANVVRVGANWRF